MDSNNIWSGNLDSLFIWPQEIQLFDFTKVRMPVASIESGQLCKVWEIKTLGKSRDAEAKKLLESVAKQVQPIMIKRKWRVKLLSEFCPSNPSLLGLNVGGGAEIKIRLRRPGRESEFYPYEDLVGTMLHELTHNEHGPHDAKFYKLLDEITKECEELMAKGISGTGQGFDAPGRRLGGFSHNPPLTSLRQSALAAAEKRARRGNLIPSGPNRVGGDREMMTLLTPTQAAAMAAERRLRDDIWCAAPVTSGNDGVQRAMERENGFSGPSRAVEDQTSESDGRHKGIVFSGSSTSTASVESPTCTSKGDSMWKCGVCTLLNPPLALICGACGTEKSGGSQSWACRTCTLENPVNLDKCSACEQWRYSYGPPVAVRGPYVGT